MWFQTSVARPFVYMSPKNLWDHIKIYAAPIWPDYMHKCIARNVHLKFLLGAAGLNWGKILHEGNLHMTLLSADRLKLMTCLKLRNTATPWLTTIPLTINQRSKQYFLMKIWIQTTTKMPLRFHFELHFKTVHTEHLSSHNDRYWDVCSNYFVSERLTEKNTDGPQNVGLLATQPPDVAAIPLYWLYIYIYIYESPSTCWKVPYIPLLHHIFNSWPIWLTTSCWEEWSHSYVVQYTY